ncbi:MAG: hypothetical protein KatS3mg078_2277 [Deltaproteobacteria bacterium]|nr:MAG: hypothetical protein KatS3mg078_2277 [Deltaproteobacteria bacterium]
MRKIKFFTLSILVVCLTFPCYAAELTLGGFPSFMRTRVRFIKNATFISAIDDATAQALGFSDADDNISFADTRLRLTPQLVLSDSVTIRAQVDVFDNVIWGGATSALLGGRSTLVNSSITTGDRFRGALLIGTNAIDRGIGESFGVDDNVQFFNVRMLHADIVLPANLGFVRIGRQPFDWGMGILGNGGWDPLSDLGFFLDRFLYLKSWPLSGGTFTFIFVTDRFTQGNSVVTAHGDGWDGGAFALVYNHPSILGGNITMGVYLFPWIHQENFGTACPPPPFGEGNEALCPPVPVGADLDLRFFTLYSAFIDYKTDFLRLTGEIQGGFGEIEAGPAEIDIEPSNILFALRAEVYPSLPIKFIAAEFGWASGDEFDPNSTDLEGSVIFFNPAYNIDNLLFKHMIPTVYQAEGSVINAFYARVWGTVNLLDRLSFSPQVLVAWNQETDTCVSGGGTCLGGIPVNADRYMATELEGTFTVNVVPGVNLDIVGSIVIAGEGLKDLLEAQARGQLANANLTGTVDAEDVAWAVQGRLLVFIDEFLKK